MILRDMTEADLDVVLRIEREVHTHPWTLGNFSDALRSKYVCKMYEADGMGDDVHARDAGMPSERLLPQTAGYASNVSEAHKQTLGYAVLMQAVDEAELLDIAIDTRHQRHGWGRKLLEEMMALARRANLHRVVLEVRASNVAAIGLYRSMGFADIGLRRDYYQAENGREDAILMGREL